MGESVRALVEALSAAAGDWPAQVIDVPGWSRRFGRRIGSWKMPASKTKQDALAVPYLHQRWNQGCTDAARLFDEIRDRGYTGSQRTVRRHLDQNATLRLKELLARCPEPDAVAACVASFAEMMTDLDGHRLPAWLDQAQATGLPPLKSLVNGIRQDLDAVTAGLSMHWNSGRVEGNVNRIKRIKRDGYGRASFELLRLQVLHAD